MKSSELFELYIDNFIYDYKRKSWRCKIPKGKTWRFCDREAVQIPEIYQKKLSLKNTRIHYENLLFVDTKRNELFTMLSYSWKIHTYRKLGAI